MNSVNIVSFVTAVLIVAGMLGYMVKRTKDDILEARAYMPQEDIVTIEKNKITILKLQNKVKQLQESIRLKNRQIDEYKKLINEYKNGYITMNDGDSDIVTYYTIDEVIKNMRDIRFYNNEIKVNGKVKTKRCNDGNCYIILAYKNKEFKLPVEKTSYKFRYATKNRDMNFMCVYKGYNKFINCR